MHTLLENEKELVWSKECHETFEKSKQWILNNNILELYDAAKPIIVASDASPYGIGACMSHLVNGVEKSVHFTSSTLSPAETNYSQLHREVLAIAFAVKKFD